MAVLRYDFHSHPKLAKLPLATLGLYAKLLSYCSANLTDGHVPGSIARQMDAKRRHFGRLMAEGLVDKTADGYDVCNYLDHNPTKAQVEQKRREARERMAQRRAQKPADGSREHGLRVAPNVHDIGKDNYLLHQESATSRAEPQHPARVEGWELPGDELATYRKKSA